MEIRPVFEVENLCQVSRQAPDITKQMKTCKSLEQGTVIIRFRNYELHAGGAALFNAVNGQYPASYFMIYIVVSSMIGFTYCKVK